ncbi:MAG: SMC-Scp complex subunit ScpB [Candidatus Dormibacteraeota bacterium]|uniref:SMC-Scp complex subunit ScpB n=1 Tax=Candidatus Dormiibacter inghamiae TaxID=3127013 RepID=A0A934NCJ9_9BACT|nr:SMC-Scp complex subunit ScpB [Candidatus Dormibacteraeota bacterium]MBJ7607472.1 SMC-Scp complex subunit ScpB [Candidatus Dormibacteraeota bacterium]
MRERQRLSAAIEAILFSSTRPLDLRELQRATEAGRPDLEVALGHLRESLETRGLMLQRQQDQVQLVTRPEVAAEVRRALRPEVAGRLSPAAYETLAIVAYQQPVTRARIEEVRGVSCEGVLANLELRGLISEVGRAQAPGLPKLYGTTMRFLQLLGLESLQELPVPPSVGAEPDASPVGPVEVSEQRALLLSGRVRTASRNA